MGDFHKLMCIDLSVKPSMPRLAHVGAAECFYQEVRPKALKLMPPNARLILESSYSYALFLEVYYEAFGNHQKACEILEEGLTAVDLPWLRGLRNWRKSSGHGRAPETKGRNR